jgi:UDP-2,3-diacylglucosamine hydrolase
MIDIVFISDLHLHPEQPQIQERFNAFLEWAKTSVKSVYILGDFFHAWAGDDSIDEWSLTIARQLRELVKQGVSLFYMHGNRDFLLGNAFAQLAGWTALSEPTLVYLGKQRVLLAHGDSYCIKDVGHKRFRMVTRNKLFPLLFLLLPLKYRQQLVDKVRDMSQSNQSKSLEQMDVVASSVIKQMNKYKIKTLIHGHTHKPGLTIYQEKSRELKRYVLSDWDDTPHLLCYNNAKGVYFFQLDFRGVSNDRS